MRGAVPSRLEVVWLENCSERSNVPLIDMPRHTPTTLPPTLRRLFEAS